MQQTLTAKAPAQLIKTIVLVLGMGLAAYLGSTWKPTKMLADTLRPIHFKQDIPDAFGAWQNDRGMDHIVPDPTQQAFLNKLYNDTVTKTYMNSAGQRIMFSAAYGKLQADDTLQLHNPEICYSAQGFAISGLRPASITVAGKAHSVHQMLAKTANRPEVVTYWIVVGEKNANTRTQQKLVRMKYAMQGYLSDGLLMRVSSIDTDPDRAFKLHAQFANDLAAQMNEPARIRYFGQP